MRFLIFLMLVVPIIGCGRYNKMTEKCRTTCKDIQKENVGARFMWRDIKLTFGKSFYILS